MNCLFIVQGEGRGHMTQAIALAGMLRGAGHRVSAALVGRSPSRDIPAFFFEKIGAPVVAFDSPNFVADRDNRSIRMFPTVLHTFRNARRYRAGLACIGAQLQRHAPDLVVNFFEPLAGIYWHRFRPGIPMVCVGHQYLAHHPAFPYPEGQTVDRWSLQHFTDLTALGASRRLALSFVPHRDLPTKNVRVVPPLLRQEVRTLAGGPEESYLLLYLLNPGYADEVIAWHRNNRHVPLHCFWDDRSAPPVLVHDDTLSFHRIDDRKFLSMMSRCRGLLCTAGFESVCEAMYMGKPAMMVPVRAHFEQQCNALDAVAAGAGISADRFDLDRFLEYIPAHESRSHRFRDWVDGAPQTFLAELERAASLPPQFEPLAVEALEA